MVGCLSAVIKDIIKVKVKMPPIIGRPVSLNHSKIKEAIVRHKKELVEDNRIVSKSMEIWSTIGDELVMAPAALYTYVVCNRNNIKNNLLFCTDAANSMGMVLPDHTLELPDADDTLETTNNSLLR